MCVSLVTACLCYEAGAKGTTFWTPLYVQHSGNTCCIRYLFNTYKIDEDKGTDLWKLAQRASDCILHTIIGIASQMLGFFSTLPYLRKPCLLKQIADKWPSKEVSGKEGDCLHIISDGFFALVTLKVTCLSCHAPRPVLTAMSAPEVLRKGHSY